MNMQMTELQAYASVRFRPRRLAHGNFFVTDLEKSVAFYREVCGLNVVFEEPGISAVFFSNGSSHHDVAVEQVQYEARIGRDGQVQVPEGWATSARLNHLGWEMETEHQLVEAYERAVDAGLPMHRTADHQISRSVYLWDAEHNYLEIYADAARDWRAIYAEVGDELLTGDWDPLAGPGATTPHYHPDPQITRVETALAHAVRTGRAVIVVENLEEETAFYRDVAGLDVLHTQPGEFAVLAGQQGRVDLSLLQTDGTLTPGLHHFGLELADRGGVEAARERILAAGIALVADIDSATKRSIVVDDPDGMHIELFAATDQPVVRALPSGADRAFHL